MIIALKVISASLTRLGLPKAPEKYVLITSRDGNSFQTKSVGGREPNWDEVFYIKVSDKSRKLNIKLFYISKSSEHYVIGELDVAVGDLLEKKSQEAAYKVPWLADYPRPATSIYNSIMDQDTSEPTNGATLGESPDMTVAHKTIYKKHIDTLTQEGGIIDITHLATPRQFRLLDCTQFIQHQIIQIDEFEAADQIPIAYSAISYVWRGNDVTGSYISFTVVGAEDADPISIDVLKHACTASIQYKTNYIWLDRLSIMQTSREDKNWQISKMYQIYRRCSQCIILPGGLGRLVHLDEETAWIHRAWTLQEVLAPETSLVLFAWELGSAECTGEFGGTLHELIPIKEVIPRLSAVAATSHIVNACIFGQMKLTGSHAHAQGSAVISTNIFGAASPGVMVLGTAMSDILTTLPDALDHAIWQCAMLRTSSRPVDMVFSIMGLFGVVLDTRAFHRDDRLGATIALAQQILKNGGKATWLGAAIRLPPCAQLSTFPEFPQTSVAGKALLPTKDGLREVADMMDNEFPNAFALDLFMPDAKMDEAGYLTFSRAAVPIVQTNRVNWLSSLFHTDDINREVFQATDGSIWKVQRLESAIYSSIQNQWRPRTFAVLLGWFQRFNPTQTFLDSIRIKAMLVEEHAPERFHLRSYFSLKTSYLQAKERLAGWKEYKFAVGGPNVPNYEIRDAVHVSIGEKRSERRHMDKEAKGGAEKMATLTLSACLSQIET